eukprot:1616280-Rhodomonas_salina.3
MWTRLFVAQEGCRVIRLEEAMESESERDREGGWEKEVLEMLASKYGGEEVEATLTGLWRLMMQAGDQAEDAGDHEKGDWRTRVVREVVDRALVRGRLEEMSGVRLTEGGRMKLKWASESGEGGELLALEGHDLELRGRAKRSGLDGYGRMMVEGKSAMEMVEGGLGLRGVEACMAVVKEVEAREEERGRDWWLLRLKGRLLTQLSGSGLGSEAGGEQLATKALAAVQAAQVSVSDSSTCQN